MILGQPPIEPDVLANRLVPKLANEIQRHGREADWTHLLNVALREIGKDLKHVVNPDPDNGEPSQFLLDLVWWRNAEDMDIALAVESEWGRNNEVWHDFGKLLVIKSPLKLMIFEKQPKDTVKIIQELYMQKFTQHIQGEHYLLIEFNTPQKEACPFHFLVPASGRLHDVVFRRLPSITWS